MHVAKSQGDKVAGRLLRPFAAHAVDDQRFVVRQRSRVESGKRNMNGAFDALLGVFGGFAHINEQGDALFEQSRGILRTGLFHKTHSKLL